MQALYMKYKKIYTMMKASNGIRENKEMRSIFLMFIFIIKTP